ncbi:MAG: FAD-dependent oxidoreductase [Solirubrobacterales bacterium]
MQGATIVATARTTPRWVTEGKAGVSAPRSRNRVAVLGGGLQGACVAMELAAGGATVDLFEARERCLTAASSQNEGKIHLGYVYANDPTRSTAQIMVRGALSFWPLLRRWLGDAAQSIPVSRPFNYVVHARSLLSAEQVEGHLHACHELARQEIGSEAADYLGHDPRVAPVRLSRHELAALYDRESVSAAFRTPERAIDPEALAGLVRRRLDVDPSIRCRPGSRVQAVQRRNGGHEVEFLHAGRVRRERYDQVVNALWESRLAVDRTMGIEPPRRWMWREKHYVRVSAGHYDVPCTTIVLGPFGDVVAYPDGDLYLSWYPVGLRGVSTELAPPAWPSASAGGFSDELRHGIQEGLTAIVPAVGRLPSQIDGAKIKRGLIFAWGQSDIDDPASELHERHAIGVHSFEGYHSVDTGKLTTAPLFGKVAADRVLAAA